MDLKYLGTFILYISFSVYLQIPDYLLHCYIKKYTGFPLS